MASNTAVFTTVILLTTLSEAIFIEKRVVVVAEVKS
jgi:hypothetical protein